MTTINNTQIVIIGFTILKKHFTLLGIAVALLLLVMASFTYPGGTPSNPLTVGYRFTENYISHLLEINALNGQANTARPWAVAGVLLFGITIGLSMVEFAKKIPLKSASVVITYGGLLLTLLGVLVTIPSLHHLVVTLSSIISLIVFFYITVMLIKSKLTTLKVLSVLFLMAHYVACYQFFTRSYLEHLPLMQKIIHISQVFWLLGLRYFTHKQDFEHIT
ncbi:MAG: hypothetical protein EAY81_10885 [Bacteroidetes bacterium]|nr:MAG: hypothetical protein EAY81_10885 [Bacteroidota bacterium]